MRYVIIGNSTAGVAAVEGIRQMDQQGEITIITNEPYHTYSRPLISYFLLGKVSEENMKYRHDGFYADHHCTLLRDTLVTRVNAVEKQVVLSDGRLIAYDRLLVATGSSAFVPPFDGLDAVQNKFTLMCLDDAKALHKALTPTARVLIIGAGLIGLKCAEGILAKVSQITMVDLAPKILSSILDEDGARLVQEHLQKKGIHFKLSSRVKRFEPSTAILDSGEQMTFDVLVLAVGVRPNTHLLKGIAHIQRGVAVNERSETSAAHIYAAGDCTQALDVSSGENRIMALLPNAYMQGECAGINMAGGEATFEKAIPMNAIGFFGLHLITAGHYQGDEYIQNDGGSYKKLFYDSNRLNGYILIGKVEKAGIYTSLIRERTPLDTLDFGLICTNPGLMAFAKEERKLKLGGGAG